MLDPRIARLAEILVHYSARVKRNDHVLIRLADEGLPLAKEVFRLCLQAGAIVRIHISDSEFEPIFYKHAQRHQLEYFPTLDMREAKWQTCNIGIFGDRNTKKLSNMDSKKISCRSKVMGPIRNHIVQNVRWVICDYPTQSLAQDADMSLDEYEDFVFDATNIEWEKVSEKQKRLKKILDKGKTVRILGQETELCFGIGGRTAICCDGRHNMPDGEVFMAPDEMTVNGKVSFEFPAIFRGKEVEDIQLFFEKGLCTKANAKKNQDFLLAMLDTDKGSRRIGEFGIGTNYGIKKFTRNILFDEKIGGTIHLAMGMAYQEGGGKNKSALHWDMIKDLRHNGEIHVDGKAIERKGKLLI